MVAKAYHPISLLECCGKLLEKIVAAQFSWEVDHLDLIGGSQFGSRHLFSTPDAALALCYKAETTILHKRIGAVLLFDISRFFDHLQPTLIHTTLLDLGVDPHMVSWVISFMSQCSATLSFNGFTSDTFFPDMGMPQGSPLSPILSVLITSPLFHAFKVLFDDSDLTLYVDDGCLYASGPTFISAAAKVTHAFETILDLLRCMGLEINVDKTELMFFTPPRASSSPSHPTFGARPFSITISLGNGKTFDIRPTHSLRYLGVFFTPKLDWSLHIKTMANQVRSTVKALGVLGNSVRGLPFRSWCKLFHSIILPILTYGSSV